MGFTSPLTLTERYSDNAHGSLGTISQAKLPVLGSKCSFLGGRCEPRTHTRSLVTQAHPALDLCRAVLSPPLHHGARGQGGQHWGGVLMHLQYWSQGRGTQPGEAVGREGCCNIQRKTEMCLMSLLLRSVSSMSPQPRCTRPCCHPVAPDE